MLRLLLITFLLLAPGMAAAQAPVVSRPYSATSYPASGTIAVTNTFQDIWAENDRRVGCIVQNTGTNPMYVFFGDGSPSTGTSVRLLANAVIYCNSGGVVYNSRVRITGTATETFYAAQQ